MNPREDIYPMRITERPYLEASFRPYRTPMPSSLSPGANKSLDPFLRYEPEQSFVERSSLLSNTGELNNSSSLAPLYRTMEGSPQFTREESLLENERQRSLQLTHQISQLQDEINSLQRHNSSLYESSKVATRLEADNDYYAQQLRIKEDIIRQLETDNTQFKLKVEDLRTQIESVINEKAEVFQNLNDKYSEIELLRNEVGELRRELMRKDASVNAHRIDLEKTQDEKATADKYVEQLKTELEGARSNVRRLEDQLQELSEVSDAQFKVQKLSAQVKKLKERNENLELELRSRPSQKQFRETLSRVKELEVNKKSRSITPKRTPETPIRQVMRELRVNKAEELVPTVRSMKSGNELLNKLSSLVAECMPEGSFQKEPSYKQIWKWVRMVVEDVIQLKKQVSKDEELKALVNRLQGILGVGEVSEVSGKVVELVGELHSLKSRLR